MRNEGRYAFSDPGVRTEGYVQRITLRSWYGAAGKMTGGGSMRAFMVVSVMGIEWNGNIPRAQSIQHKTNAEKNKTSKTTRGYRH